MSGWLVWEWAAGLAGCLWLLAGLLRDGLRRRRRAAEERWRHCVARELTTSLLDEESACRLPRRGVVERERHLAEVAAALIRTIYALNPLRLREMLLAERVDRWLARRVRRSCATERARYLKLAADLPPLPMLLREAVRCRASHSRKVRFCALLVEMAAEPAQLLRLATEFERPFTPIEVAEILALLRRGLLPVAYRPLLESESANLQRLGLALVAEFGIVEAEQELVALLESSEWEVARQSLYLLLMLHRPLPRRVAGRVVQRLTTQERRRLVRFMVREAYNAEQIGRLLGADEACYSERLAASYKRALQPMSIM